jgi:hypothetical protein
VVKHQDKTGTWYIKYNPKPIPTRSCDYDFWHEDYDGPEDNRCGNAESAESCLSQIEEIEDG